MQLPKILYVSWQRKASFSSCAVGSGSEDHMGTSDQGISKNQLLYFNSVYFVISCHGFKIEENLGQNTQPLTISY